MTDTSSAVQQKLLELFKQRTGEERLAMGCSMHEAVKALVLASIRHQHPDFDPDRLRQEVFLRFYGRDMTSPVREKILQHLL